LALERQGEGASKVFSEVDELVDRCLVSLHEVVVLLEQCFILILHEAIQVTPGALLHFLDGLALFCRLPTALELELEVTDLVSELITKAQQLLLSLVNTRSDHCYFVLVGLLERFYLVLLLQLALLDLLLQDYDLPCKVQLQVLRFDTLIFQCDCHLGQFSLQGVHLRLDLNVQLLLLLQGELVGEGSSTLGIDVVVAGLGSVCFRRLVGFCPRNIHARRVYNLLLENLPVFISDRAMARIFSSYHSLVRLKVRDLLINGFFRSAEEPALNFILDRLIALTVAPLQQLADLLRDLIH